MYQTIYNDEKGHSIFYDKKNKKLAELHLSKNSEKTNVKSNFGGVALIVTLISNSIIGKFLIPYAYNPVVLFLEIYSISILSGLFIFLALKLRQTKMLNEHQIIYSEQKVIEIIKERKVSYRNGLIKTGVIAIIFSLFFIFSFCLMQYFLLLFFTWLFSSVGFTIFLFLFFPFIS